MQGRVESQTQEVGYVIAAGDPPHIAYWNGLATTDPSLAYTRNLVEARLFTRMPSKKLIEAIPKHMISYDKVETLTHTRVKQRWAPQPIKLSMTTIPLDRTERRFFREGSNG